MVYSNGSLDPSEKKQQQDWSKNSGSNKCVPGHPSLSTWNPPLDHEFSAKQMEALTCLCDALVPSVQQPLLHHDLTDNHQSSFESFGIRRNVDDVNAFYNLSASDAGVPPIVAGMLTNVLKHKMLMAISIILWLLSTAVGTFLLGGWATVSKDYPYIRSYSCLGSKQQERVLRGWSVSSIPPIRAIFKLFKSIVLWAYYCKVSTPVP